MVAHSNNYLDGPTSCDIDTTAHICDQPSDGRGGHLFVRLPERVVLPLRTIYRLLSAKLPPPQLLVSAVCERRTPPGWHVSG